MGASLGELEKRSRTAKCSTGRRTASPWIVASSSSAIFMYSSTIRSYSSHSPRSVLFDREVKIFLRVVENLDQLGPAIKHHFAMLRPPFPLGAIAESSAALFGSRSTL